MKKNDIAPFFAALKAANPTPQTELEYTTVFELLTAVLLSAQATDVGVNKATRKLFPVANTPQAILDLGLEGLESYIKTIGLYRSKAKHLMETCRMLVQLHGGTVPRTREELEALPGVGRKTANVVRGHAFGLPAITTDTHVLRVSKRLGWTTSAKPEVVETDLQQLFDPSDWTVLSDTLIFHGRRRCHAKKPACGACVVGGLCPSYGTGPTDPDEAKALVKS